MSKIGASMNIFAVICRCHRQMTGNLSKKRKSSTGRSKRSGLPDAVNPDRASMSLCNGRFVAVACQHMTRAIRGADFEERTMAESRCNAQVVTARHLFTAAHRSIVH